MRSLQVVKKNGRLLREQARTCRGSGVAQNGQGDALKLPMWPHMLISNSSRLWAYTVMSLPTMVQNQLYAFRQSAAPPLPLE